MNPNDPTAEASKNFDEGKFTFFSLLEKWIYFLILKKYIFYENVEFLLGKKAKQQ